METTHPGQHILASFFESQNTQSLYNSDIIDNIEKVVTENGLQILRVTKDSFGPDCGYTSMIILAESHISIHTWPELNRVDLDLFTCNVTRDNREATKNIYDYIKSVFDPKRVTENCLVRGQDGPYWGYHLALNLKSCNPAKMRSKEYISQFTKDLCDFIDMKRFGETVVVRFGESEDVAGYSMMQLIETSNTSAHFVEKTNDIYFDIFSCKSYDVEETIKFCMDRFEAKNYNHVYLQRQV